MKDTYTAIIKPWGAWWIGWIAEIPEVPGAMAYGETVEEAKAKAYALALYAVADDVEKSKDIPDSISVLSATA